MKLFGVVGWKNTGKTTLVASLVRELTSRGRVVSTLKHAHKAMDVDKPGTDSFTHREAGAHEVLVSSPYRWALMHEIGDTEEAQIEDLLPHFSAADFLIIEGYKKAAHPKIETYRKGTKDAPLAYEDATVRAVAADCPIDIPDKPRFDLNAISAIADFVEREAAPYVPKI